MNRKIKVVIAAGGTGGHVFPGVNLAKHLIDSNYELSWLLIKGVKDF